MIDCCYGTDLISHAYYSDVWRSRFFAREDVDHYLYEVVKKQPDEYAIHAYDGKGAFVKEIPADFWKVAYGSFLFFNAQAFKVSWYL